MSDSISRQDALDAIRPLQTYKLFEGDDMILVDKAEVQTELMMLPSAEPKTMCVAKVMLSDEQVQEAFEKAKNEIVQTLPSAQPDKTYEQGWKDGQEALREEMWGRWQRQT